MIWIMVGYLLAAMVTAVIGYFNGGGGSTIKSDELVLLAGLGMLWPAFLLFEIIVLPTRIINWWLWRGYK